MDLQYIRKCIKIVNDAQIAELEIEEDGKRLRITRNFAPDASGMSAGLSAMQQMHALAVPSTPPVAPATPEAPVAAAAESSTRHEVRSPIVGTFYRSSSPDADPFVQVGDTVSNGQVLCIIEAMKIMNEIESDASGRVVKILVDDGKPVEYNQPLFLVEPA
ncbi:MAG: acetyl-CoA carboxylase biotin carboxyl carrier protein [Bacteroidetes bacterium]|nr:acetyl-CoA carboxylase biotin carboxyl carrier protein [Bacteroidota bacterium]